MKPQRPFEADWDYLFVLDAARYDAFEAVYADYFDGTLEKRDSEASATPEWVNEHFDDHYDVTYFSANPFINSLPYPLKKTGMVSYETTPSEHVSRIVDIWDDAWDDTLGTVKPEDVNSTFEASDTPETKAIVHYMQPHAPFLGHGKGRINKSIQGGFSRLKQTGTIDRLGSVLDDRAPGIIERLEDSEVVMKLAMLSNLDLGSLSAVLRGGARETLLEYHEDNLRRALDPLTRLASQLDGRIVVTSDHGEAFGEQGVWGHHVETHIPVLTAVPWLEVDRVTA
jgi:hypothetical protein